MFPNDVSNNLPSLRWQWRSTQRSSPKVTIFPSGSTSSACQFAQGDLCCVVLQANVAQFLNDVPNLLPLCCRMSLQTSFVTRRSCAWVGCLLPYPMGPPQAAHPQRSSVDFLEPTIKVSHSALCEVAAHLRNCCTTERNSLYKT